MNSEVDTFSLIEGFLKESENLISYGKKCFILLLCCGMTSTFIIIMSSVVFSGSGDNIHLILAPIACIFVPAIIVDLYKSYKLANYIKSFYQDISENDIRAAFASGKGILNIIVILTIVLALLTPIIPSLGSLIVIVPLFLKAKFNKVNKELIEMKDSFI